MTPTKLTSSGAQLAAKSTRLQTKKANVSGAPEKGEILTNPDVAASMGATIEVVAAPPLPAVPEGAEALKTVVGGLSVLTDVVARIGELPTVTAPARDAELSMPCSMGFTPPSLQPVVTLPSKPTRGNSVASGEFAPENQ